MAGAPREIGFMTETIESRSERGAPEASPTLADGVLRRRWSLVFLSYLPFYFIYWLFRKPGLIEIVASFVGLAAFIVLFLLIWRQKGRPALWQVLTVFGIGMVLSPFNAGWSVYTIYAMSFAARISSRRTAVRAMVAFEIVLLIVGLVFYRHVWPIWASGALFGGITGFGALMQADIERKNQALVIAHEEVRGLATMAERERISRDLHDLLGHTLTLVAVKAELAARLASRDAEAAEREMQAVAAAAREALAEVRTAVVGMKGATLTTELERARQALASASVEADVQAQVVEGYPGQEAVLAMALREAVTNVIRHANASRCEIRVETRQDELVLSVADNGKGGRLVEGSGLKGMRARLSAIGGALQVKSGQDGARLVAVAPLSRAMG
jgi:two-component system sensor histidine kinase DesK